MVWLLRGWLDVACHAIACLVTQLTLPVGQKAMERLEESTSPMPLTSELGIMYYKESVHTYKFSRDNISLFYE